MEVLKGNVLCMFVFRCVTNPVLRTKSTTYCEMPPDRCEKKSKTLKVGSTKKCMLEFFSGQ